MSYDYNAKSKASNKCNAQQREAIVSGEPDTGKTSVSDDGAALLYSAGVPRTEAPPRGRGWVGRGRVLPLEDRGPTQDEVALVVRRWKTERQHGRGWREVGRRVLCSAIPHGSLDAHPMRDVDPVTAREAALRWLRRRVRISCGMMPWRRAVRVWLKANPRWRLRYGKKPNAV